MMLELESLTTTNDWAKIIFCKKAKHGGQLMDEDDGSSFVETDAELPAMQEEAVLISVFLPPPPQPHDAATILVKHSIEV